MSEVRAKISIEIQPNGVYMNVHRSVEAPKVTYNELVDIIESYDIPDVEYDMVKYLAGNASETKVKISENIFFTGADEIAFIDLEDNDMKAYIRFLPPVGTGENFTDDDIKEILEDSGIVHGILEDELKYIIDNREYEKNYLIALGTDKIDGEDGYLDYHFNTEKKTLTPKQLEDGSVDYQNLDLIEKTYVGKSLVTVIPPTNGSDGINVLGEKVPAVPGKPADQLRAGKNCSISEDEQNIIAEIDGQVEYVDRTVSVLPVFEITGDVGNSTGNINFNGSVIVRGVVTTNFSITCKGNLEVYGIVEGATINCEGDAYFYAGIMGGEKATINVKGDITTKFIDSATVNCNSTIHSKSVMHSNVTTDGSLIVTGKKAVLVGGKICVGKEVTATIIGSYLATRTEIIVGNTPAMIKRYEELLSKIETYKFKIQKIDKILTVLKSSVEELTDDKKELLLKSYHTKVYLVSEKKKLEEKVMEMLPELENKQGKISASEVAYPGILVAIGSARMRVDNEMPSCTLVNRKGKIEVKSFY